MVRRDNAHTIRCRFCRWAGVLKAGWRYNKRGKKQRYRCLCCGRRFIEDDGFLGRWHRPNIITRCIDLYFSGLGTWKVVQYILRHHRSKISRMAIWRWAKSFGRKVHSFLQCLPLNPRKRNLHCDEKRPKVRKKESYLWLMAFGTPHFIAEVNLTRDKDWERPQSLFKDIKGRFLSHPPSIVTDGLGQYNSCEKFFHNKSRHVVYQSFRTWPNNNRIERLNGSVADWLRRRGLHGLESARDIILGWTVHHNFVNQNSRLDKTPAQGVGLHLPIYENTWKGLIELASW